MSPHPPGPPPPEKTKPSHTVDLEEDEDMPELDPLDDEVDFGNDDDDEIPEPSGPPPPEKEEEVFHSAEEAAKTEEEDEYVNRDDPSYSPPAIPSHPAENDPTVLTPGTSGSKIWPKIRDLMKVIPTPGAIKWDDNDARHNTSQKTGEREKRP